MVSDATLTKLDRIFYTLDKIFHMIAYFIVVYIIFKLFRLM